MYKIKLAPDVEAEMLNSSFWSDKLKNEKLLTAAEIKEINQKIYNKAAEENKEEYYCDLKKFADNLIENKIAVMIDHTFTRKIDAEKNYYNLEGDLLSLEKREEILANAKFNSEAAAKIKYGILIKRSKIRALPTVITFASEKESGDQDLLQLTALACGTAAVIMAESRDQNWYYIQTKLMRGWVKKDNIALTDSLEAALSYLESESFLVVSGSRVETEPNPFDQDTANRYFQMGDKIPLVEQEGTVQEETVEEIPENHPHGQSKLGNYLIWLPTKDKNNNLKYKKGLISAANDLNEGYLDFKRENIVKQAFKMLGERYDWGGKYERRDCSRFIMDVFRSFGIELPRNADLQEKLSPFENYIFSGNSKERRTVLKKLKAGDILHLPGHIMLYLGEYQHKNYLIHAASGYGELDEQGKLKKNSIRSVFIMKLEQLLKDGANTYLEKFSSASKIKIM
ncbi:MAG: NlpC/P60 family protein [Halanaerobium sp.]